MNQLQEASETLAAGFEFGAYRISGCIGRGSSARVYCAEHRALRKCVALKVMASASFERDDFQYRFVREGQAAAAVRHPNVVDVTDVGVWQGLPFLVMEFLEGEDLEHYLVRNGPLSEMETARLMIPVVAGLAAAHERGVVHRDLKPSNIFLARGPGGVVTPKLLDFGISKLTSGAEVIDPSLTPLGVLMGTPLYMSPESIRGAQALTPSSDQYSLGVVLYECLTGQPPFHGNNLLEIFDSVTRGDFPPPRSRRPDLSPMLEDAILKAMRREPEARFDSVREVGSALCPFADEQTRLLWATAFGFSGAPERISAVALKRERLPIESSHRRVPFVRATASWLAWATLVAVATSGSVLVSITLHRQSVTRAAVGSPISSSSGGSPALVASEPAPMMPSLEQVESAPAAPVPALALESMLPAADAAGLVSARPVARPRTARRRHSPALRVTLPAGGSQQLPSANEERSGALEPEMAAPGPNRAPLLD